MLSLMCSALYSRRSIRSFRAIGWGRGTQVRWRVRGGKEEYLTGSFLTRHLWAVHLNTLAALMDSIGFPRGHWIPSVRSFSRTQLPPHPVHMSGTGVVIYSFMRSNFLQELLFFGGQRTFKQSCLPFLCLLHLFFFLKDYQLQHKETTLVSLPHKILSWMKRYWIFCLYKYMWSRFCSTPQPADSFPYFI